MRQALVLLSDRDTDAPDLPGVATVSKDDAGDRGAHALGFAAAARGALWVDRPYWTGNPTADWLAATVRRNHAAGALTQLGNEQNDRAVEGFVGDPDDLFRLHDETLALLTRAERASVLASPPSPGFPLWQRWVHPTAERRAVHAYGALERMTEVVQWYLDHTAGDLFVTECNPGAGNTFDLDAWAERDLRPFLDWCAQHERIRLVAYFAWRWDLSPALPTSIDAVGTGVERVLRAWTPPTSAPAPDMPRIEANGPQTTPTEGSAMPDVQLSVPTRQNLAFYESEQEGNYSKTKRARTIGVVIHSTGGGSSSLANEANATANWFQNRDAGVSAHRIVGPTEVITSVPDDVTAYHARENNADHLGLEFAVPDTAAFAGAAYPAFYYEAAGELLARWAATYGFPLVWVSSQNQPGLIEHQVSEAGKRDGKRDPTGTFSPKLLLEAAQRWRARLGGQPVPPNPTPTDPTALRDQTYAAVDAVQKMGAKWRAAGYPQHAQMVEQGAEALKSGLVIGKGEK